MLPPFEIDCDLKQNIKNGKIVRLRKWGLYSVWENGWLDHEKFERRGAK